MATNQIGVTGMNRWMLGFCLLVGFSLCISASSPLPTCPFVWQKKVLQIYGLDEGIQLNASLLCEKPPVFNPASCQVVKWGCRYKNANRKTCVYEHRAVPLPKATHVRCLVEDGPRRGAIYGAIQSWR